MIAIVNYDTGNIRSVTNALARVGCTEWIYTDDKALLTQADKVILPGVGEASTAMAKLAERGLDTFIPTLTQPVLGICVGTQLMCQSSEEGDVECMGIFRTKVKKFQNMQLSADGTAEGLPIEKIPHMGWNKLDFQKDSPLFSHIQNGDCVYFVHSYYAAQCQNAVIATAEYGADLTAAVQKDNVFGCQFHPEKSGTVGLSILRAFAEMEG